LNDKLDELETKLNQLDTEQGVLQDELKALNKDNNNEDFNFLLQ
jgi:hypothetical protein